MSSYATRWRVIIHRTATAGERDGHGRVEHGVLNGWLRELVDAIVEDCPDIEAEATGQGATVEVGDEVVMGEIAGEGEVAIGGGVTEIYQTSLGVSAKFRSEDSVATGSCRIRLLTSSGSPIPVSDRLRDALIARAHAARHFL